MVTATYVPKLTVDVQIEMSDGTSVQGQVFIQGTQRVLDLLNDPRPFFPFRHGKTKQVVLINKAFITSIKPIE